MIINFVFRGKKRRKKPRQGYDLDPMTPDDSELQDMYRHDNSKYRQLRNGHVTVSNNFFL